MSYPKVDPKHATHNLGFGIEHLMPAASCTAVMPTPDSTTAVPPRPNRLDTPLDISKMRKWTDYQMEQYDAAQSLFPSTGNYTGKPTVAESSYSVRQFIEDAVKFMSLAWRFSDQQKAAIVTRMCKYYERCLIKIESPSVYSWKVAIEHPHIKVVVRRFQEVFAKAAYTETRSTHPNITAEDIMDRCTVLHNRVSMLKMEPVPVSPFSTVSASSSVLSTFSTPASPQTPWTPSSSPPSSAMGSETPFGNLEFASGPVKQPLFGSVVSRSSGLQQPLSFPDLPQPNFANPDALAFSFGQPADPKHRRAQSIFDKIAPNIPAAASASPAENRDSLEVDTDDVSVAEIATQQSESGMPHHPDEQVSENEPVEASAPSEEQLVAKVQLVLQLESQFEYWEVLCAQKDARIAELEDQPLVDHPETTPKRGVPALELGQMNRFEQLKFYNDRIKRLEFNVDCTKLLSEMKQDRIERLEEENRIRRASQLEYEIKVLRIKQLKLMIGDREQEKARFSIRPAPAKLRVDSAWEPSFVSKNRSLFEARETDGTLGAVGYLYARKTDQEERQKITDPIASYSSQNQGIEVRDQNSNVEGIENEEDVANIDVEPRLEGSEMPIHSGPGEAEAETLEQHDSKKHQDQDESELPADDKMLEPQEDEMTSGSEVDIAATVSLMEIAPLAPKSSSEAAVDVTEYRSSPDHQFSKDAIPEEPSESAAANTNNLQEFGHDIDNEEPAERPGAVAFSEQNTEVVLQTLAEAPISLPPRPTLYGTSSRHAKRQSVLEIAQIFEQGNR
ncbi:hypothetical protein BU23DRAFT_627529 [Bimuria novae-zelandiae CBS 107.79]|uniref:Uncharacterized protein n=1 Tax=Bimuria novae-zelandiae CBS 107.79 TaxID=1447943 RepID=A0A6A5UNC5_9PLEO|nr:hypothetical protein BU23DRAFT_627529 [Bimuria novae-zelandiae CBS 107.79]